MFLTLYKINAIYYFQIHLKKIYNFGLLCIMDLYNTIITVHEIVFINFIYIYIYASTGM